MFLLIATSINFCILISKCRLENIRVNMSQNKYSSWFILITDKKKSSQREQCLKLWHEFNSANENGRN